MAKKTQDIPWSQIYDYVIACGQIHDPYLFCVTALEELRELVPYDQGLMWCLDESRNIQAQHLVNIKPRWANMYIQYYSQLEGDRQSLRATANESFGMPFVHHISWSEEPETEFLRNYIMARGVKSSLTFVLFDLNALPRAVFSLDRTRSTRFSEKRIAILRLAVAHLGNLYKNFFTSPDDIPGRKRSSEDPALILLTNREREVVDLMCQGLSPKYVAHTLHISLSTAYKHIAHIYQKLHVSSQQELLVRVLGRR